MGLGTSIHQGREVHQFREQVALANRLLHHYGLASYQGHASARIPGTDLVIIRAFPAVSTDRTQPEDLMIMDLDGNVIEASTDYPDRAPSWSLHTEIYKARSEVGAVVHTHQKWCTIFGIAGRPVLPVLHAPTALVAAEPWPVYEETRGAIGDPREGRVIAELMGEGIACHLRNHGMVFVGPTIARALITAADAEEQAEITWRAMLMGTPQTIQMRFLRDEVERRSVATREEERGDGVRHGEWANHVWLDENRDAIGERRVIL